MHPQPPRHPAPVYEHTEQPSRATPKFNDASQCNLNVNTATSGKAEQEHTPVGHPTPAPVYEDVVPVHQGEAKKNATEIQLQDLEMKKNVAYDPV